MPLVAKDSNTGARIDITQLDNPRLSLKSRDMCCPYCDQTVFVVGGKFVCWHFRHKVLTPGCPSSGETPEHLAAKAHLRNILKDIFDDYTDAAIDLEVWIPEINRRADIMVSFPMGWRVAHEIQLSGISIEELEERTHDYYRAGIDVYWWLGKNGNTPANQYWCREFFGFFLTINVFTKQEHTSLGIRATDQDQLTVELRNGRTPEPLRLHE